jgi:homocysteine S-methyltransferase
MRSAWLSRGDHGAPHADFTSTFTFKAVLLTPLRKSKEHDTMALYRAIFPNVKADLFLVYVGMETDLLFTQGVDLPGFASYTLLETDAGRTRLQQYFTEMIDLARVTGMGVILESPTWVCNRDRGVAIGYTALQLRDLNQQAISFMVQVRTQAGDVPTIISANIGPRYDAYAPADQMSAQDAEDYHAEQISALAQTAVDVISAYTLAYAAEAIGIVRAARRFKLPVVIAFTVETDGKLPDGQSLEQAITEVDAATEEFAAYYMINCAHPEHFEAALEVAPWMQRLKGVVANASRCSHAELDEAQELDDGDPVELGAQLAAMRRRFPQINVLGGCCGTDMRHMREIAKALSAVAL